MADGGWVFKARSCCRPDALATVDIGDGWGGNESEYEYVRGGVKEKPIGLALNHCVDGMMEIEMTKETEALLIGSIQRYVREELEVELSDMRAKFLFDYIRTEIMPVAYNQGVKDAEGFLRARLEDLGATCYEDALTYWVPKRK